MSINIVAAIGKEREIGVQNDIPWKGKLPEDMKRFKELTIGNIVVMGRKTFESIGRPLKGRTNVIITTNIDYEPQEGCVIYNSLELALNDLRQSDKEVFIIGGSQIYQQVLPITDRMHLTLINEVFPESDAYFPVYHLDEWTPVYTEIVPADEKNRFESSYIIYERKKIKES